MSTTPSRSSSHDPTTPNPEDTTMSTGKNTSSNSLTPTVPSPTKSPISRLSNGKDGAGWANDQDTRPKPLRHKFSDLKKLKCQVIVETNNRLAQVKALELEKDDIPDTLSQEDKIRVVANSICARPGELLLSLNASLRQALLDKFVTNRKALFDTDAADRFFQEDNLTVFVTENTESIGNIFKKMADISSSQDSELKNVLHTNCMELALTFLTKVATLLTNNLHNGHFAEFCSSVKSLKTQKEALVYLESHIRNISFTDTLHMALEDLPAGSPINSLQTVNDNVEKLAKKTERLNIKVAKNGSRLSKSMNMVADIKSQEVATRQSENEHKVRLHNITSLHNFRESGFRGRLDIVSTKISDIAGNKIFNVELITPRPNAKFFESLAIITFPTPAHKYTFEKRFSDYRKDNTTKLSCSRTKMVYNDSDIFEPDNVMKDQIKLQHDTALAETNSPHADHAPLTDLQVKGIQINLKQLKGPNRSYFECMDPTNGTFFLVYNKSVNPFSDHDFSKPIANPFVRKMAETSQDYLRKFKPRVWKNNQ